MSEHLAESLVGNVGKVLLGKDGVIRLTVTTLLAGGHLLIEDRPGLGKTLLARALAKSLDLPFQRLQCTADLLPADILGARVYHPKSGELSFHPGPIFTSVLLADELNRAPPRTQSALLESMAEARVSFDRETHTLPDPFFVIATQNPSSFAGTYPLPESQLDRFLMRIQIGYPDTDNEVEIVAREDGHSSLAAIDAVAGEDKFREARKAVGEVRMQADLVAYLVSLADATRRSPEVTMGVSPRGAQCLHRACKAWAYVAGRDYVIPDDVRALLSPVFAHRMSMPGGLEAAEDFLENLMRSVRSPE
ncbi:MAG: AAA family ATPase [Planctomycetota bacterium]|jgi:MoxR-like ATPase